MAQLVRHGVGHQKVPAKVRKTQSHTCNFVAACFHCTTSDACQFPCQQVSYEERDLSEKGEVPGAISMRVCSKISSPQFSMACTTPVLNFTSTLIP